MCCFCDCLDLQHGLTQTHGSQAWKQTQGIGCGTGIPAETMASMTVSSEHPTRIVWLCNPLTILLNWTLLKFLYFYWIHGKHLCWKLRLCEKGNIEQLHRHKKTKHKNTHTAFLPNIGRLQWILPVQGAHNRHDSWVTSLWLVWWRQRVDATVSPAFIFHPL